MLGHLSGLENVPSKNGVLPSAPAVREVRDPVGAAVVVVGGLATGGVAVGVADVAVVGVATGGVGRAGL